MKKYLVLLILFGSLLISCETKMADPAAAALMTNLKTAEAPSSSNLLNAETPLPTPSPTPVRKKNLGIDAKVGVVSVSEDDLICFRTRNPDLEIGTPVSIVGSLYEQPQKVFKATIEKKLLASCVDDDSDIGESDPQANSFYLLKLNNDKADKYEINASIGIVKSKKFQIQNKLASVDLNSDGTKEFFRSCTSSEGLHLTIWSGRPLIGKRIWHRYYYLRYDTEPNCRKKDYAGAED